MKKNDNILINSQSPQLWDDVAETYSETADAAEIKLGQEFEQILSGLGIEPGASLLEVGCGSGHLSGYLAGKGFQTTLIDFSKVALEKAKKYYEQNDLAGNFVQADMFDLSADLVEPHDVVWNSGVLEHFDAWKCIDILKKMGQLARKYVLVLVPNAKSIPYLLFRKQAMENGEWIWGRELLRDSMKHLAEAANLEVIEEQYIGKHFSYDHFNYVNSEVGSKYQDLDQQLIPQEQNYLIALIARPRIDNVSLNYEKVILDVLREESRFETDTYYFDFRSFNANLERKNIEINELGNITSNLKSQIEEKNGKIDELQKKAFNLKTQIAEKDNNIKDLQSLTSHLETQVEKISKETLNLNEDLRLEIEDRELEKEKLMRIIQQMENSVSWRMGQLYENFIPYDSKTTRLLRRGISRILLSENSNRKLVKSTVSVLQNEGIGGVVRRGAQKISHNTGLGFNPYNRLLYLKPITVKVIEKDYSGTHNKINFSLIIPVKNEGDAIAELLRSIEEQSVKPDELIVVEHGSTDNTVEEINEYIKNYSGKTEIRLIQTTIQSLANQRNVGISEAKNEYIALLDVCDITPNLFANLLGPIAEDPSADLVSAIYYAKEKSKPYWTEKFIANWKNLNFENYIPCALALLIKKSNFEKVGGFPEYLDYTGEDTIFSIKYRKISRNWIINKAAYVFWDAPNTKEKAFKKKFSYARGDGENGFGDFGFYEPLIISTRGDKPQFSDPTTETYFKGYLEGRKDRINNLIRKKEIKGNFLVLSGVPLTDSGGGQRGTQIALELMKKKYKVTFCNVYPSFEEKSKVFLDIEHHLLELYYFEDFPVEDYIERHKQILDHTVILLELPHPDFIPYINRLKSINPKVKVIYDCIDNWDSTLGWKWYSKEKENEIIELSDVIVTSAKTLFERLKSMTDEEIYLIPNSVNTRLFDPSLSYKRPSDLPHNERKKVMYAGALWGKWFDWRLLEHIAGNLPDVDFVIIGNISADHPEYMKLNEYKNVHFLGLKNQFEIPQYLFYSDACIIPFIYDKEIIKYTNPLKVYEYIAMNKPVVSTYMDEIVGFPDVFLSKDYDSFLSDLKKALDFSPDPSSYGDFVYENSWTKRISDLEKIIE